ncbi:MAG: sulfotransferase domain-containing protein [Rhodospirillaceae bacterium]|nr:sulfotransferase domain-containing protein [Rhodospirillaceae bacterium]
MNKRAIPDGGGIFWLASYPKSGNTWARCLISSLLNGGGNVDLQAIKVGPNSAGRGWIEQRLDINIEEFTLEDLVAARVAAEGAHASVCTDPCCIKVHDRNDGRLCPATLTRGVVYIVRDPRDVAPSWAKHMNVDVDAAIAVMADPNLTLSRLFRYKPQVPQELGSWSGHVLSWLDDPPGPLLLLRYEEMLADPERELMRLARFLGLDTDTQTVSAAVAACRFEILQEVEAREGGFAERPAHMERFFRQGKAGAWRETLNALQASRIVDDHGAVMRRLGYL